MLERFYLFLESDSFAPTLILVALIGLAFIVLMKAQRRPDFDIADMLRDEQGKISSTRIFAFISLAVSSWIVAFLTVTKGLTPDYYFYYLVCWSGATVVMKAFDKWDGSMPFGNGGRGGAGGAGSAGMPGGAGGAGGAGGGG